MQLKRYIYMDGLRGWASLIMLFHHGIFCFFGYMHPIRYLFAGRMWVSVFFVLSGFVLSIGYITRRDPNILYTMAARRYVRLTIPIAITTAFAYTLLAGGLMYHLKAAETLQSAWMAAFYRFTPHPMDLLTFPLYKVYFEQDDSYNSNLWTMPIELIGSMGIFAVLFAFGHRKIRWAVYAVIAAACTVLYPIALGMLLGVVLAEFYAGLQKRVRPQWAVFALALVVTVASVTAGHDERDIAFSCIAFTICLGVLLLPVLQRLLSLPVSQFLGRIAFMLYLVQIPIICSLGSYVYVTLHAGTSETFRQAVSGAVIVIGSLALAIVLEPVERFAIRISHIFADALPYRRPAPTIS